MSLKLFLNFREVEFDEDVDLFFDVLLTKIDVRKAPWGLYNFYKMQVTNELLVQNSNTVNFVDNDISIQITNNSHCLY